MYDTFECHFKPNQKLQSDMTDPVVDCKQTFQHDLKATQFKG